MRNTYLSDLVLFIVNPCTVRELHLIICVLRFNHRSPYKRKIGITVFAVFVKCDSLCVIPLDNEEMILCAVLFIRRCKTHTYRNYGGYEALMALQPYFTAYLLESIWLILPQCQKAITPVWKQVHTSPRIRVSETSSNLYNKLSIEHKSYVWPMDVLTSSFVYSLK